MFSKTVLKLAIGVIASGLLAAGAQAQVAHAAPAKPRVLKVATGGVAPYADILKFALDHSDLKQQGIDVQVVQMTDFVQINPLTAQKQLDANFFQHFPFLDQSNHDNHTQLVPVTPVFTSVFGAYSRRYKSIKDLPDGSLIVFPNDPANSGRSLALFADYGLITLRPGAGIKATQADIAGNPHHFKFREVDQLMLTRTLDDADLVAINAAYILQLGMSPAKDALITEKVDRFPSGLVARPDNKNDEAVQKLAKALTTPEVRQFMTQKFGDSVKPLF
ncbi:MetQ/NlpA family ABC transporter substrate-binding protein [Caballeronia sp. LZ034LL]|uniref:MetQ/NlpA family ABC transporter substrate-binding protein n=1 Tax=Caballeronia sp. LZ034LL TaxID=3038567 RepID=UPI00286306B9|nr:MetQ/NlpA family ABC transporter substrate-binding protein [Caballeronia sp. LZ034LL]MDR5836481.1 MetQ/NlpA family ABC transporter substrate-binding protein [Caballeronia sp. LZ034LL]